MTTHHKGDGMTSYQRAMEEAKAEFNRLYSTEESDRLVVTWNRTDEETDDVVERWWNHLTEE